MNKSLNKVFLSFSLPGVSYRSFNKIASGLDRVTHCINKGPLVPFSGGGGGRGRSKCVLPQKSLKFQSPKNAIFGLLGTKFEDKRACFFSYKNVAFVLSVTQSIPTSNGQMMKAKIHTFARKQILRCVNL